MNNVKKGDVLEKKAIEIIHRLIDSKILYLDKEYIKIHSKKKYQSNIRKGKIEFDLSIEVWPPNADRYSMIYLLECKNYDKRVPMSEVKKFYDDIMETQGVNAKGIFISNSPLQKGAYEIAEVRRMMVIEGESKDDFKITLYRKNKPVENRIPIMEETVDSSLIDEGVKIFEKIIDAEILNCLAVSKSNVSYGIDLLTKKDISIIAKDELNKLNEYYLTHAEGLDANTIANYLKTEYGIEVTKFNPKGNNYLGTCNIEEKTIGLSKSIVGTPRELFVLCHEFGHFILHQKLSINQVLLDSFSDSVKNLATGKHSLENPNHWLEWQANYFSVSFLLPETSIAAMLWKSQLRRNLPKGNLYLDDQRSSQKHFNAIIAFLAYHFNVSKTSVIYRLEELQLITHNTSVKTVGELIRDYKTNFFA
ncbi:ImmA/IrrE family metallo-endopeptidase [Flavivirga sp. 57AJ16]|uniref:ImmA/IrrE family metallo-endopeptidase n=1 Tax=Flavivirga sp. 57AJ16 TaxID=3025307 RepID=UPI002365D6BB|nr:ImmA/IrrE family metallo-endopeptidase [Flavivirga sp. 57AJ16]MDD7887016.1 ImmA/IrrE family metallo-endopeptidase [Flavivirga sp. 57AJ16]